jgi:hypothetical protein
LGKSIYEKEMLAILHAMDLWRPYLLGQRFQIKIDHQSLKYFLEQRLSSPEQQKWVTKLMHEHLRRRETSSAGIKGYSWTTPAHTFFFESR